MGSHSRACAGTNHAAWAAATVPQPTEHAGADLLGLFDGCEHEQGLALQQLGWCELVHIGHAVAVVVLEIVLVVGLQHGLDLQPQ